MSLYDDLVSSQLIQINPIENNMAELLQTHSMQTFFIYINF